MLCGQHGPRAFYCIARTPGRTLKQKSRYYSPQPSNDAFKILFLGRSEFSCLVLEELLKATDVWNSVHVATHPDEWIGRNRSQLSVSPLKILSQERNIPITEIPHSKIAFKSWQPPPPFGSANGPQLPLDHVIITASFGRILPASLLRLFAPSRRLNVHPSLLPLYRGPAPIQHALMNGDTRTGVCVIEMMERSKGIDAGPIWGSSSISIPKNPDFFALQDLLAREGGSVLVSVLREMLRGTATAIPQAISSESELPRATAITVNDSIIDFDTMSAENICWRYRAISSQVNHLRPLITFYGSGVKLQLHSVSIYTSDASTLHGLLGKPSGTAVYHPRFGGGGLFIRCAGDSLLRVPFVKQENKSLLSAGEWWNGVKGLGLTNHDQIVFQSNKI